MSAGGEPPPEAGRSHPDLEPARGPHPDPGLARGPGPEDLVLDPERACDLVSEHGGEIVIMDDGRVVFMNASEHLVEIAAALDPDNPDVKKRLEAIGRARAEREPAAREAGETPA